MVLVLKIVWNGGSTKSTFTDTETMDSFIQYCSNISKININELQIFTGFPKQLLQCLSSEKITEKGITSGAVVSLEKGRPQSLVIGENFTAPIIREGEGEIFQLLLDLGFQDAVVRQALDIAGHDFDLAVEICQELAESTNSTIPVIPDSSDHMKHQTLQENIVLSAPVSHMTRQVIDADNSCLFNAIITVLSQSGLTPALLREIIATTVLNDTVKYNASFLGKSPTEYASWITQSEVWGGEIEMFILAQKFDIEIVVVDIESNNHYTYGKCSSDSVRRVFLLYDGAHYDCIVKTIKYPDGKVETVTMFSSDDIIAFDESKEIAAELKKKKKFINLSGCDLRCMICGVGLKGQPGALAHAKATGHQNFGQV
eukprot:gene222-405_t